MFPVRHVARLCLRAYRRNPFPQVTVMTTSGFAAGAAPVQDVLEAALDALPAHIAILDQAGTIMFVNAAWRGLGAANSLTLAHDGVGTSYLDACRSAVESGDEYAINIVHGMQAVLSGECETCVFDYPCHAPQERLWFAFRISRLHTAGAPRFLVCHDNVTPQCRAEEQARINEARYQAVFSGVGDAILVSDAHGKHLDANPAAE